MWPSYGKLHWLYGRRPQVVNNYMTELNGLVAEKLASQMYVDNQMTLRPNNPSLYELNMGVFIGVSPKSLREWVWQSFCRCSI